MLCIKKLFSGPFQPNYVYNWTNKNELVFLNKPHEREDLSANTRTSQQIDTRTLVKSDGRGQGGGGLNGVGRGASCISFPWTLTTLQCVRKIKV